MRRVSDGFTTAATTFAGRVAPGSSGSPGAPVRLAAVHLSWGSSAASTIRINLVYGLDTSATPESTLGLVIPDSSGGNNVTVPVGVLANWWELSLPTTMARGCVGIVYGD